MKLHILFVPALIFFSCASYAQSKELATFHNEVTSELNPNEPLDMVFMPSNSTVIITYKNGNKKTYNTMRIKTAKKINLSDYPKDTSILLANRKKTKQGVFNGIEGEYILLKKNEKKNDKIHISEFEYFLTEIEKDKG